MSIIAQVIHDLLYVHPPHTLVNHFPIALLTAALFFILLALWKKSDLLEIIAFADLALGSVSTLIAGILGIRDNLYFYKGLAPNHTAKIVLAAILLVLTAIIAIVRWRNPKLFHSGLKAWYVASYFINFAMVSVLGFLGGVILFGF